MRGERALGRVAATFVLGIALRSCETAGPTLNYIGDYCPESGCEEEGFPYTVPAILADGEDWRNTCPESARVVRIHVERNEEGEFVGVTQIGDTRVAYLQEGTCRSTGTLDEYIKYLEESP